MKTLLIFLISFFTITVGFSQEKLEREFRIKQSEVPLKALEFILESFGSAKVKWYGEENLNAKTIEAKGKLDGRLYSVEFDTNGALQDVEIVVDFYTLPQVTQTAINQQFALQFSKYKLQKTQIQWLGSPQVLSSLLKKETPEGKHIVNYEITLKGTADRHTEYYEFLLSDSGNVLRKSKIIERNNHNLIY